MAGVVWADVADGSPLEAVVASVELAGPVAPLSVVIAVCRKHIRLAIGCESTTSMAAWAMSAFRSLLVCLSESYPCKMKLDSAYNSMTWVDAI